MKNLFFLICSFLVIGCQGFTSKDKAELNLNATSQVSCDHNNCSSYTEITLQVFTGFKSADCQNIWQYEVIETLNNNEELCGKEGSCYIIVKANYEQEKIECDGPYRDYYRYTKINR